LRSEKLRRFREGAGEIHDLFSIVQNRDQQLSNVWVVL